MKLKSQCAALQSVQTETFSVGIWSRCSQCESVAGEMAGCSTDAVRLQQNSCHRICCVFLEQCMFWCLRNEASDGHFQQANVCYIRIIVCDAYAIDGLREWPLKCLCVCIIFVGFTVPGDWQYTRSHSRVRIHAAVRSSVDGNCLADQTDTQPGFCGFYLVGVIVILWTLILRQLVAVIILH